MTYIRYGGANLAQDTITPWISAAATTVTVDSKGGLFPAHNGSTDYDYLCLLEQLDANGAVTKREGVRVTARTSNQFTIVRSAFNVPWSDTATSQGTTAYAFDEGARFSLFIPRDYHSSIFDGIDDRITKVNLQNAAQIYEAAGWSTNTYTLTLDPAVTSYSNLKRVIFKANAANTGSATLNVNGLWAKTLKKNNWADDLESGDIASDQIVFALYDETNDYFVTNVWTFSSSWWWIAFWDGSDGDLVVASGTTNLLTWSSNYYQYSNVNQELKHPKRDRGSDFAKDMDDESLSRPDFGCSLNICFFNKPIE